MRGLLDGGVDLLIVETCQDLLQTKAALAAIFEHFEKNRTRVPVIAQVTIEVFGTMLNGTEIGAALTALAPFPIDVIGMNCGTGPRHMTESIRYLCENAPLPVSVLPNAGLPSVVDGKMHYDETPESFHGASRPLRQRLWRQHRRRLLRHHAGASEAGGRSDAAHHAESSATPNSCRPRRRSISNSLTCRTLRS